MTDNEKAVMTDCYKFLNEFNQPPARDDPMCDGWWEKCGDAAAELQARNRNHPLAMKMGVAVFEYLEEKWRAINRKRGV